MDVYLVIPKGLHQMQNKHYLHDFVHVVCIELPSRIITEGDLCNTHIHELNPFQCHNIWTIDLQRQQLKENYSLYERGSINVSNESF